MASRRIVAVQTRCRDGEVEPSALFLLRTRTRPRIADNFRNNLKTHKSEKKLCNPMHEKKESQIRCLLGKSFVGRRPAVFCSLTLNHVEDTHHGSICRLENPENIFPLLFFLCFLFKLSGFLSFPGQAVRDACDDNEKDHQEEEAAEK